MCGCLLTFIGTLRGHLCNGTAFLLVQQFSNKNIHMTDNSPTCL